MTKLIYLKIFVLVAALGMVFYIITHMSPEKVETSLQQVGLQTGGVPATVAGRAPIGVPASSNESINLCRTRIQALVWPDGRKIQEFKDGMKLKWQAFNLDPADFGTMEMEKWLSLHCEVATSAPSDASASSFTPYIKIEYIDGTKEVLARSVSGDYRFSGKTFASPDLDKAVSDLISLANLQPTGP